MLLLADTAVILFWALLASGQLTMRKIDDCNTLSPVSLDQKPIDLAA